MLKQQFNGVKRVLAISLAVLFVASLTIASASACAADNYKSSHCDKESCWSKENSACKTCGEDNGNGVCKTCGEDNGNGVCKTCGENKENGVCKKCASHHKHNHKNNNCSKKCKKCASC
jgi:hypothetical protein